MREIWYGKITLLILFLILTGIFVQGASASVSLTAFDRCSFNSVSGTYAERQVKEIDFLLSPNGDPAAIMFAGPAADFSGLQYPESRKFLKHNYPANPADSGSMQYFIEEHSERNSPYSYTVNAVRSVIVHCRRLRKKALCIRMVRLFHLDTILS